MMPYFDQLTEFFNTLNTPDHALIAFAVYLATAAVVAVLRVGLFLGYQTQRTIVSLNARPLKTLSDLQDARQNILTKAAKDYISFCESGITALSIENIVKAQVDKLNLLGWSFLSILRLVEGLERSLVLVGLLLALLFESGRISFGLTTLAVWVLLLLCSAVLDIRLARDRLLADVSTYVLREVTKFFTPDLPASLAALRNTLSNAIETQSDTFAAANRATGENLAASISKSLNDMTRSIEHTLIKLADADTLLKEPLSHWSQQITRATQLQTEANQTSESLVQAITQLSNIAVTLNNMSAQLENHSPDKTIKNYETTLQELTTKLGDGFGTIVDQHVNQALKELTGNIEGILSQMTRANQDLTQILRKIADRLDEQGRNEVRAIASLKDQIHMKLEEFQQPTKS